MRMRNTNDLLELDWFDRDAVFQNILDFGLDTPDHQRVSEHLLHHSDNALKCVVAVKGRHIPPYLCEHSKVLC